MSSNAEAEALYGHPLQYAMIGRTYVGYTEDRTDAQVLASAGMPDIGLPVERFNRCPTCEQWAPCDVVKGRRRE